MKRQLIINNNYSIRIIIIVKKIIGTKDERKLKLF